MDDTTYTSNSVSIQFGISSAAAGSDDSSSTLGVYKDDFKMYNVNVTNTFPGTLGGSPAIALSEHGYRASFYTCAFIGFQDTVLAEQGTQVYLNCYFEVIKLDKKRKQELVNVDQHFDRVPLILSLAKEVRLTLEAIPLL
jgi:pectin methylesterase-like acyl-CoA thioesterase